MAIQIDNANSDREGGIELREKMARRRGKPPRAVIAIAAIAIAVSAVTAGALVGLGVGSGVEAPAERPAAQESAQGADSRTGISATTSNEPSEQPNAHVHEHVWSELTETVTIPAVTQTVRHDAEHATETVYDSFCNVCGELITGNEMSHADATGHASWTGGVAHVVDRVTKEAYDEEVILEPERTETVHSGWLCEGCGEIRP